MIKKTDILKDILQKNANAEEILLSFGMHCLYCPCAQAETLEEACEVHELDVEVVLKALNKKQIFDKKNCKFPCNFFICFFFDF